MTRDDLEFMRQVAVMAGRSPAAAESSFRDELQRSGVTAAVIAKPKLVVVSMDVGARHGPSIQKARSGVFELIDRSPSSIRSLHSEIERFVTAAEIREIFLRDSTSQKGDYAPHSYHFRIETVLQLAANLTLTFVNSASVRTWVTHNEPELPTAESLGMGKYWDDKQDLALETALFVADNVLEPRFFSDGSKRED